MIYNPVSLCIFFIILVTVIYWLRYMATKELAVQHCRQQCLRKQFELLDDTISLDKTNFAFKNGRLIITRSFDFDYSPTGHDRKTGNITCTSQTITHFNWEKQMTTQQSTTTAQIIQFPDQTKNRSK